MRRPAAIVLAGVLFLLTGLFLRLIPVPTWPTPPPPPPSEQHCVALARLVFTENWRQPSLPAGELRLLATPNLAAALAATPHLTPGEVEAHVDSSPTILLGSSSKHETTVLVDGSHFTCTTTQSTRVASLIPRSEP